MDKMISIKQDFGLILVGAIIFTASFMWKDLFMDIEEYYFPKEFYIGYRIVFVLIITALLVLLSVYLKGIFGLNNTTNSGSAIAFDDSPIDNDNNNITNNLGANDKNIIDRFQ